MGTFPAYHVAMSRIRLGDLLISAGVIDELQLKSALSHQRRFGGRLGQILVDLEFVDEMVLWRGLAKQLNMPMVSLPTLQLQPELLSSFPADLAERHQLFPVQRRERELFVATGDPGAVDVLDEAAFRTGAIIRSVLAPPREIEWAIRYYYQGDTSPCPPPRQRRAEVSVGGAEEFEVIHTGPQPKLEPPKAERPPTAAGAPVPEGVVVSVGPQPAAPAAPPPLGFDVAQVEQTTHTLRLILNTCIQRGLFTKEEYLEKLQHLSR